MNEDRARIIRQQQKQLHVKGVAISLLQKDLKETKVLLKTVTESRNAWMKMYQEVRERIKELMKEKEDE